MFTAGSAAGIASGRGREIGSLSNLDLSPLLFAQCRVRDGMLLVSSAARAVRVAMDTAHVLVLIGILAAGWGVGCLLAALTIWYFDW